ncbi:hypothetical protein [Helicobacter cetorum]|uniref:Portal protein n=1 Tax=Helicobacter cetorum (strain ATCC BAA-429 / MIT 00-7128) TaxID=182217 RepID=I0ELN6_HELC0|nr:hypothetical protein [Helicobacter cetorum]AFI03855.1 hypothetical protein HCW_02870 [Helicobacter cetorum MIT 00-7128]
MDFTQLKNDFKNDLNHQRASINEFLQAKKYYHGNQLPPDVLNVILERGQTPIVENLYKMIVNKILGYKIESITEIRLTPRQETDRALADLLNDLLKVFSQKSNYDKEVIKRDKDLIMGGLGVVELWVNRDKDNNIDIDIKALSPESFIIDYFSTDNNANDARRFHKILKISEMESKSLFPNTEVIYKRENDENFIELIESWYKEFNPKTKEYEWNRYLWNSQNGIYKSEIKPFKHSKSPFIVSKLYTDENNHYYGIFRDLKPMQDYINYAENRMGNMMGSFKAMFEEDAVTNIDEFVETMSLDNAIAKVRPNALKDNKIQFMNNQADLSALSQKAEQKRQLLKVLAGLNDESLGVASNRASGVAIAQRRESGLMGLQTFLKASDDMDKLMYSLAIDFISHYFTKEQVFRIVDKKVGDRYFSINTNKDNQIKPLKFDLIYKSQLKTETKDEKWSHWNELLKIIAPIRPDLMPRMLPLMLQDMDSPITAEVQELISEVELNQAKQVEAQAPLNQQIQALEMEKLKAQIMELQAKAHKYTEQGQLVKASTDSEQINQALQVKQAEVSADNSDNKLNNKNTWRKYPSSMNLDY